ncbi:MAG: hypothetical protein Q8Q08_10735 [Candidatus Omnitrophota bacterium]|nr:hypothetical protein [Candidatus Omnitrophota bacterium]MDZ4241553.1 hypothetical protein [Candidatus Omnitrophota bacterium]
MKRVLYKLVFVPIELAAVIPYIFLSLLARAIKKNISVGLGPEPLINNVYHKRAFERAGFTAETFVNSVYFITQDFDFRADLLLKGLLAPFRGHLLFIRSIFRYQGLYIYFHGGPLMETIFLWRMEPLLYRLAGVKVVVMPYGSDVQEMSRSPNLLFKHTRSMDYPSHRSRRKTIETRIDLWTRDADHIISGCEWVDYMYHWDTLMLGHFSIDTEQWTPAATPPAAPKPLKILHAPNHRNIKGTAYFTKAVQELRTEGVAIELVLCEKVPNDKIREMIHTADIVADQLIVGWYAMFALEAMSMGKPVLCYLRPDLIDFYTSAGLIRPGEIPIINCNPLTLKETLKRLAESPQTFSGLGEKGRQYVLRHHSLESVGKVFAQINSSIGISPRQ